jgi:hypothetical protein
MKMDKELRVTFTYKLDDGTQKIRFSLPGNYTLKFPFQNSVAVYEDGEHILDPIAVFYDVLSAVVCLRSS